MPQTVRYRVGVDIGGTFTDLILVGTDETIHARKVLSTPDDYGRGIVAGIRDALADLDAGPEAIERVVHATTVATNAVLEHKGARTGLITTEGFRDVLEMRRLRIPEMYTLNYRKPDPLVPRRLRLEVRERMGPQGEVRIPLDEDSAHVAAGRLEAEGVDAVAICLIHAYANSDHERRVAAILRQRLPDAYISISSELLPVIREYERTSTTVINAFLGPTIRRYFESLARHLAEIGIDAPLQVMKSDGGVMSVTMAADRPAYIVESGPAAGVIGAAHVTRRLDESDCISLDMGGTTAKAAIVEGGKVTKTADYEVGAGINLSSRLIMGGGYAVKLPVVDVSEIGAGGGSIVSVDSGGLMRVGPQSAGAMPGPVAYNFGGEEPTFTDAVITLGYLNPEYLVDGGLKLDAEAARAAIEDKIARVLGKDPLDTAHGIYELACGTMMRAVKAVSTYRGRDPRDFGLFAFGGNGPVVAARIAEILDMRTVRIPPKPGVFSAYGLLLSDIEHEASQGHLERLSDMTGARLRELYAALDTELDRNMALEGYAPEQYARTYMADLRYRGQAHELAVECPSSGDLPDLPALARAFGAEHERTYGHQAEDEEVECVTLRVLGRVKADETKDYNPIADIERRAAAKCAPARGRRAFFGPEHGHIEVPVIDRGDLLSRPVRGPAIVEEYDSTCVVLPGWQAGVDERGNILLQAEERP